MKKYYTLLLSDDMEQPIKIDKNKLSEQKDILDKAFKQLKKEFVGIDNVIEQIAIAIKSWLLFPDLQERPVIINLWGLTGTGKTSLIKRLTKLIGFEEFYFHFDLGESSSEYFDIQDYFRDIYENCKDRPFIIGLDEFQFARTINEDHEEINRPSIRAIWSLLDTGKFDIVNFDYYLNNLGKLIKKLDSALFYGVEVENGLVIANEDIYNDIIGTENNENYDDDEEDNDNPGHKENKEKKIYFISDESLTSIYNLVSTMFVSKNELRKKLNEMDGDSTVNYLIYLHKKAIKPKTVDCSKALVFVMGNLDEVYSMTQNFNPDISADEFHRQSKDITITKVKESLLGRFRSEQIARLGNTHIIYPSFNEEAFRKIIDIQLNGIADKMKDAHNLQFTFDDKIKQLIYDEGVFPTQGTRPLFTTIYQIINTRIGTILNEIYLNEHPADEIIFTVKERDMQQEKVVIQISFRYDNRNTYTYNEEQELVLGKLRKETRDDIQAIVAVHESGHAILSAILQKTIPETILSTTADSSSDGFVLSRPEWEYMSKKEIVNRIAVLLGGFVAERMIFGDENVTMGAASDIGKATKLATHVLYSCGMGKSRVAYGNEHMSETPSIIFDNNNHQSTVNQEARDLITEGEKIAEETLRGQKTLLIKMADYLSDHRCMKKEEIKEFVGKYARDFDMDSIIENGKLLFYRNHLKDLVYNL